MQEARLEDVCSTTETDRDEVGQMANNHDNVLVDSMNKERLLWWRGGSVTRTAWM